MLKSGKRAAAALIAAAVLVAAAALAKTPGILRFFRREVVISVAGDILLDRGVAAAIERSGAGRLFEGVAPLLKQDDITIANLECPLTLSGGGAMKEQKFVFKADPGNAAVLKSAGIDMLALANNHTMDYLSAGLSDTMDALTAAGIHYAGAGKTGADIRPCFIQKNGVRVGILSYTSLPPEGFMYDENSATVAYARAGFLDNMQKEIAGAASACDFLFVYYHWGTEYRHDAGEAQTDIARAAVDSGASAVVGTHPHVLQGREIYNGAHIYYSVGSFVFDEQMQEKTDEAVIVQFTVGKKGIKAVNEIPIVIKDCRPIRPDAQTSARIKSDLAQYSIRFEQ